MKLNVKSRLAQTKSELTHLRLDGMVPAVVYHKDKPNENISVCLAEYETIIRQLKPGRLSTTKIQLVDEKGKERSAIIKEIQYHPTSYKVLHLDFEILDEKVPVTVNVPLEFIGAADCVGIKLGGVIRQVMRKIKVRCMPKDMPEAFHVDIRQMNINDTKRIRDIEVPQGVKTLASAKEVAVVIAKR